MYRSFMKERPVFPLVVSMSAPMAASMLAASLYNIADAYFAAKISAEAMTALSLLYPLQLLENALAVGFGIGVNAAAAYFLGARRAWAANDAASAGLALSAAHGVCMTLLFSLAALPFLTSFTDDPVILEHGRVYSDIVFAFALPYGMGIAFEKIFQAEGRMTASMVGMMTGCATNLALDPLLIFGAGPLPGLGVAGAAWATGIGQTASLLTYVFLYRRKAPALALRRRRGMFRRTVCARIYAVGVPAAVNMGLPVVLIAALNGMLAAFSASHVLVLGAYCKLQTFIYLTANGIVQGVRPIVGYNYGAKQYQRVDQVFRTALRLILAVTLAGTALCLGAADALIGLFTNQSETVRLGRDALRQICPGFAASAVSVAVSGVLEGLGQGGLSLVISLLRYILVILPAAFFLSRIFGPDGIWNAFWIAEWITAAAAWRLYRDRVKRAFPTDGETAAASHRANRR